MKNEKQNQQRVDSIYKNGRNNEDIKAPICFYHFYYVSY